MPLPFIITPIAVGTRFSASCAIYRVPYRTTYIAPPTSRRLQHGIEPLLSQARWQPHPRIVHRLHQPIMHLERPEGPPPQSIDRHQSGAKREWLFRQRETMARHRPDGPYRQCFRQSGEW
ncbi:MAG TPA: hypothetical protein VFB60_00355 [Ktedonobacteraceae bacterium]|nr:hypothetical protein [Ktedonobacteraceae bacterium]